MPTSVHIPKPLLVAVDRRARALKISRNRLIVQALEREVTEGTSWTPDFFDRLESSELGVENAAGRDAESDSESEAFEEAGSAVKYVLDTNVVSQLVKGNATVIERLRAVSRIGVCMPQPVVAEIAYGIQRLARSSGRTLCPRDSNC